MIRRLDPVMDQAAFETAWEWLESSPRWRQESETVFGVGTKEEYLVDAGNPRRISIGIFDDDKLSAVVALTLVGKQVYEVHLEAARRIDPQLVVRAGHLIRDQMWGYGMQWAFTWVPRWNRAVLEINKAIGFTPDNVSMFRGTCRTRLIEWVRYSLRRPA